MAIVTYDPLLQCRVVVVQFNNRNNSLVYKKSFGENLVVKIAPQLQDILSKTIHSQYI
jgi:hypothetical protein